jgi:hypothetical protein
LPGVKEKFEIPGRQPYNSNWDKDKIFERRYLS